MLSESSVGSEALYSIGIRPLSEEVGPCKTSRNRNKNKNKPAPAETQFFTTALHNRLFATRQSAYKTIQGLKGSDLVAKTVSPRKGGMCCTNDDNKNNKNGGSAAEYDLTIGFGQDSRIRAEIGASSATMVERDLAVATLLQDSLRRLCWVDINGPDEHRRSEARSLSNQLSLCKGDARHILKASCKDDGDDSETTKHCDVCYVDPMFPPRQKSAAVKKTTQFLHGLLGTQDDVEKCGHSIDC